MAIYYIMAIYYNNEYDFVRGLVKKGWRSEFGKYLLQNNVLVTLLSTLNRSLLIGE